MIAPLRQRHRNMIIAVWAVVMLGMLAMLPWCRMVRVRWR